MKIPVIFFSLLMALFAEAQQPVTDILHYRFHVILSDKTDLIKGKAAITVKFLQPSSRVIFDLSSSMRCSGVKENGQLLHSRQSRDQLIIMMPQAVRPGEVRTMEIAYEGIPSEGLIISKNKFGHRTFFADNWPNRAHQWIPCKDDPADKASVEFIVTAPSHYTVISNGMQVAATGLNGEKTTHWKEDRPLSTKIMVIGVADFAVQYAGAADNVPVYSWVYPEDQQKGFYDFGQATDILPFFIRRIAPFPFKKLANVESTTIFGGMENAGAIFYTEKAVTGTRKTEALLAHEIAHQWFGDMATEAAWAHLWLSEGFATYMSMLYLESRYGIDTLHYQLGKSREKIIGYAHKSFRPVVDTAEKDYMQLLNPNSYDKGAWILHMLRRQLGDSVFWKSIRTYYARYAGRNAVTEDLRKIVEEVSGKECKTFFKQWLYTVGHPVLKVSWQYDAVRKEVTGMVTQQQPAVFQFPLELGVYEGDGREPVIHSLFVKEKTTGFSIHVEEKPSALIIDPLLKLLFEGSVEQL